MDIASQDRTPEIVGIFDSLYVWMIETFSRSNMETWTAWIWSAIGFFVSGVAVVWIVSRVWTALWRSMRLVAATKTGYVMEEVDDVSGIPGTGKMVRIGILDELREARKGPRDLLRLTGPEAVVPISVPPVPTAYKWLEPLVVLLQSHRHFIVKVSLLPEQEGRVSIQVRLGKSNGRSLESRRFYQGSHDGYGATAYGAVATRAGAWLAFMLAKYTQRRHLIYGYGRVVMFGSSSWESYALLRRGMIAYGDPQRERESLVWFKAAVADDPYNVGAHIMIGGSRFEPKQNHIEHLEKALLLLKDDKQATRAIFRPLAVAGTRADARWYQATYNLTVNYINRAYSNRHKEDFGGFRADLRKALSLGLVLARAVGATELTLRSPVRRWSVRRGHRTDLWEALDRQGVDLATLVAGPKAMSEMEDKGPLPIDAKWKKISRKRVSKLWQLLSKLDSKRIPSAQSFLAAQGCMIKKPGVPNESPLDFLPALMRYQRACALLELHQYSKSMEDLAFVLESESQVTDYYLLDSAREDPALEPLWCQENAPAAIVEVAGSAREKELRLARARFRTTLEECDERRRHEKLHAHRFPTHP